MWYVRGSDPPRRRRGDDARVGRGGRVGAGTVGQRETVSRCRYGEVKNEKKKLYIKAERHPETPGGHGEVGTEEVEKEGRRRIE